MHSPRKKRRKTSGFFEAKHTVTLTGAEKVAIKNEKELEALILLPSPANPTPCTALSTTV
ncbi:MAG: hypothetical protein ACRDGM_01625 [bacterium]